MAATPQNVEMEAAKFLHKLIQESTDEPTKLATKLHVILQHMRSSGKENSMPYQVISRAMETVINRHGLDIEALMSQRQPLTSGSQPGDSSLPQIAAGTSQQSAMENDSKKPLTTEDAMKMVTFPSKPLHGPSTAALDMYQGSANQLNPMKSHGSNAGIPGSYESTEAMQQFNNSYDNQTAAMSMHKTLPVPGKALDHEGGFSNVMANASKTLQQGGISNNVADMGMLRNEASRDTGKLPVVQASPAGPSMPFKEHHLKQLRAQCLVFLAFRNNLMPKKLHLEIALGNFFSKEDPSSKEQIDQKGKEQSIGGQSSGFISEMKEGEKLDKMIERNDPHPPFEHGEGIRNTMNMLPRKFEPEVLPAFETKEPQTPATKVALPDPSTNMPLHGHNSHLPSWKSQSHSHPGMEVERHMVVAKNTNIIEKDVILAGNNPMKSHGSNAGIPGSYESTEAMQQFNNSYDNQAAAKWKNPVEKESLSGSKRSRYEEGSSQQSNGRTFIDINDEPGDSDQPTPRPMGRDRAKKKATKSTESASSVIDVFGDKFDRYLKLQEERAEIFTRMEQSFKKKTDLEILKINLEEYEGEDLEIFTAMKESVRAKYRRN